MKTILITLLTFLTTPIVEAAQARLSLRVVDGGAFVYYTAEVGRLYRLEGSQNLTNWTLIEQRIADNTTMSHYFDSENLVAPVISSGGGTAPPAPSPTGTSSLTSESTTTTTSYKKVKPPMPKVQQHVRSTGRATSETGETSFSAMASGAAAPREHRFYRVVETDPRIEFPEFFPYVDQLWSLKVRSSIVGGTCRIEVYRDGVNVANGTAPVTAGGIIYAADPTYNAAQWPYTGYYNAREWEFRVTVTPPPSLADEEPAQVSIVKSQRLVANGGIRLGATVNMHGSQIFTPNVWAAVDGAFNREMEYVFGACYLGARQVDLNGALRDISSQGALNINDAGEWLKLRNLVLGQITDLHYTGHGNINFIGSNNAGMQLRLPQIQVPLLKTNPMFYVGLDGCSVVGKSPAYLTALTGYSTTFTRPKAAVNGAIPGFGWAWSSEVKVAFENQGVLFPDHFDFIKDFYWRLTTTRDANTGYLDKTYQDAVDFAKDPLGLSVFSSRQTNPVGKGLVYVGCTGCFFDEI